MEFCDVDGLLRSRPYVPASYRFAFARGVMEQSVEVERRACGNGLPSQLARYHRSLLRTRRSGSRKNPRVRMASSRRKMPRHGRDRIWLVGVLDDAGRV